MRYMTCLWISDDETDPVFLSSELDDDGIEIRKVELWRNGKVGWADKHNEVGDTGLGKCPIPKCSEINKDKQFRAWDITKDDFERIWLKLLPQARI